MSQKDWDPDDLLDFDYGRPVNRNEVSSEPNNGSSRGSSQDFYEELKQYEALRNHDEEQAATQPASSRVKDPTDGPP